MKIQFAYGNRLRPFSELEQFSESKGHQPQSVSHLLARLRDNAVAYNPGNAQVEQFRQFLPKPTTYKSGYIHIDILHSALTQWIATGVPRVDNFGRNTFNLLIEYVNVARHENPDPSELLTAQYTDDESNISLLEEVACDDRTYFLVSSRALRKFARELGHKQRTIPRFYHLFRRIQENTPPGDIPPIGAPTHRTAEGLFYLEGRFTNSLQKIPDWGVEPATFTQLIDELETSREVRRRYPTYKGAARAIITQYLATINSSSHN